MIALGLAIGLIGFCGRPPSAATVDFQNLVMTNASLANYWNFEGVDNTARQADKKGSANLTQVSYTDGTTLVTPVSFITGFNNQGAAALTTRSGGDFSPDSRSGAGLSTVSSVSLPSTMTIETLFRPDQTTLAGSAKVAYIVMARASSSARGYFQRQGAFDALDPNDLNSLIGSPHAASNELTIVETLAAGNWYYMATTFSVASGSTTINAYVANLTAGQTTLTSLGPKTVAGDYGSSAPLGIGIADQTIPAAGQPYQSAFPGAIDEVAIYNSVLSGSTLQANVTALLYEYANAKYTGGTLNFGIVHQGASVASQSVAIGNQSVNSTSPQYLLNASGSSTNPAITVSGFTGLAASASGTLTNNLSLGVNTSVAGSLSGTVSLSLVSNGNGVPGLINAPATVVGSPAAITTSGGVFSGTGVWSTDGGGSWGTGGSASWTSAESVAAAPGTFVGFSNTDTARFASALTGGTASIKLNGSQVSLASITFDNAVGRYVIESGTGAGSLTLASASGKPVINVVGTHEIATAINGTSGLEKTGLGKLILSGSSGYTGGTDISAGTLAVTGFLGGVVNVANNAILGGSGTLNGPVNVAAGGILAPGNSPGTLTMTSGLILDAASIVNFELNALDSTIGSGINDLIVVNGDFTLDGILNVSGIGDFSTAADNTKWRLFNYSGGTFTNGGLALGSMPAVGSTGKYFQIDTATAGQVNLVIVPEPASLALAGIGIAAAGLAMRRQATRG